LREECNGSGQDLACFVNMLGGRSGCGPVSPGRLAQPGAEIGLRIDQTLTQDATGTMVMLQLEALGLDRVRTEVSVQYVDHNLLQTDERNMADHLFLRSACQRFGLWYSKPGNGVSHPTHMQRFGAPGKTMVGSDSHTCAAGSLAMLAIGVGGLDVAELTVRDNGRTVNVVPAENAVRAGQAACSYSCRMPPSRSRRRMSSRVSCSGSVIGSGSGVSGRTFAMPWCGLCAL
jgi:aconitase family protein (aconitate hydratase)